MTCARQAALPPARLERAPRTSPGKRHAEEQEQRGDIPGVTHKPVGAGIDHALMPLEHKGFEQSRGGALANCEIARSVVILLKPTGSAQSGRQP